MIFRIKPINLVKRINSPFKINLIQLRYSSNDGLSQKITQTLYSAPVQKKLNLMENNYQELVEKLNNESASLSSDQINQISTNIASLDRVVSVYKELNLVKSEINELNSMVNQNNPNETDDDLKEMAKEEIKELEQKTVDLEGELIKNLVPKDIADEGSAILEIRAGTGGDEAALFSRDLLEMYHRFSIERKWKWEILSASGDEYIGYKEVVVAITGSGVFGLFKFESGVHRVQRIPATETQGRVHTSTSTVAIMPQPTQVQIDIKDSDLRIEVYRASGAGGQHVNTTDSAVRITHIPTGTVVAMQDERSQHKNKARALKVLHARIFEQERLKVQKERRDNRNVQIGTGDRSEKIRTYNYTQNRVTDHRVNYTLYDLEGVLINGTSLVNLIDYLNFQSNLKALSAINSDS